MVSAGLVWRQEEEVSAPAATRPESSATVSPPSCATAELEGVDEVEEKTVVRRRPMRLVDGRSQAHRQEGGSNEAVPGPSLMTDQFIIRMNQRTCR